MNIKDKNYLRLQFWNKIYEKNGLEFQSFFENIMIKVIPGFQKIRPYGNKGDSGNDGYIPDKGIYYQVYSPKTPNAKDTDAVKKLKSDFKKLKDNWDDIKKIRQFYFVFNDKKSGSSIIIEKALKDLQSENKEIKFELFSANNLEEVFFKLQKADMLALGFDVDSTKSVQIALLYLDKIKIDIDKHNFTYAEKALENYKEIISTLRNEELLLEFELLEAMVFSKLEKIREAKEKYESICIRYPTDPRAFLYLAEMFLNIDDYKRNKEYIKKAELISPEFWLVTLQKYIRSLRLSEFDIVNDIDEMKFPEDPGKKSSFYRICSLLFEFAGDFKQADCLIEKAIKCCPHRIDNYFVKYTIMEHRTFKQDHRTKKFINDIEKLHKEILLLQKKCEENGYTSPRDQLRINWGLINIFKVKYNVQEITRLIVDSFDLILNCYFDQFIDEILINMLQFVEMPSADFNRLLSYLKQSDKRISQKLANKLFLEFYLLGSLNKEGRDFFTEEKNKEKYLSL
ncbi:MAG: hypothetical protein ACM3S4_05555 [Burkholderiales bacterium]